MFVKKGNSFLKNHVIPNAATGMTTLTTTRFPMTRMMTQTATGSRSVTGSRSDMGSRSVHGALQFEFYPIQSNFHETILR